MLFRALDFLQTKMTAFKAVLCMALLNGWVFKRVLRAAV